MKEHITLKKLRNKASAEKLKKRNEEDFRKRMAGLVIPIPFDVYLEKIQGIPHNMAVNSIKKRNESDSDIHYHPKFGGIELL